ncbi:uncharacterized protein METZ01_LOCUS314003 [marine metagenome]|uniref:Uncharacterized protein n=1 Tax=marine metagenome TaxID=408172 RepID=A0A382NIX3_9ZZZZ
MVNMAQDFSYRYPMIIGQTHSDLTLGDLWSLILALEFSNFHTKRNGMTRN